MLFWDTVYKYFIIVINIIITNHSLCNDWQSPTPSHSLPRRSIHQLQLQRELGQRPMSSSLEWGLVQRTAVCVGHPHARSSSLYT